MEGEGKSRRRGENARVQNTEGKRQACRRKLQERSGIMARVERVKGKNERERETI